MYFRMFQHGLTFLGLENSTSTSTEGPSLSSGSEISSEHAVWCTLLGLMLALLVKKGLTILDIIQEIRPVKIISINI